MTLNHNDGHGPPPHEPDNVTPFRRPPRDEDIPFDPRFDAPETRQPPQDLHAERACLGAMLTAPATAIPAVTTTIRPGDYYRPAHETIHDTIVALHNAGQPVDIVTVGAELQRRGDLLKVGGAPYLHDLVTPETCPVPANAAHYAAIVLEKAQLRGIVTAGTKLLQLGHAGDLDDATHYIDTAVEHITTTAARITTTDTPSSWAALDLTPVLAGNEIDPPPVILERNDGQLLLYAGAVHTISGEPGSGKTWLTLIAALQQLRDGYVVTMIDFEDRASRVVGRLLALGAHPDQIRTQFRYIRPHNALTPADVKTLEQGVVGSTLVILDGVTEAMTLHGLDLNANADVAKFFSLLPRAIADHTGAAVVLIDHVVKDGEKQGRWGIGGQHKLAGIDGVAYLCKAIEPFGRGKTGIARITVSKDRPGYIEEIAIGRTVAELVLDARDINCLRHALQPPATLTTDEAGNMRPTHLMERVSRYLELNPGLGKRDLLDGRISGKKTYLNRAVDRLIQEGYIEVITEARGKHSHRSIRPFREDEEELEA